MGANIVLILFLHILDTFFDYPSMELAQAKTYIDRPNIFSEKLERMSCLVLFLLVSISYIFFILLDLLNPKHYSSVEQVEYSSVKYYCRYEEGD